MRQWWKLAFTTICRQFNFLYFKSWRSWKEGNSNSPLGHISLSRHILVDIIEIHWRILKKLCTYLMINFFYFQTGYITIWMGTLPLPPIRRRKINSSVSQIIWSAKKKISAICSSSWFFFSFLTLMNSFACYYLAVFHKRELNLKCKS